MKTKLALLVLLAGISSVALSEMEFKEFDANTDGFIDQEEAAALAPLAEVFSDLDQSKDGKLSEEEFEQFENPAEPPDKGG